MLGWQMNWLGPDARPGQRPLAVNAPTRAALLADLEARMAAGQGFSVATLNLDHAVKLRRDPAFRAAYLGHSHVTADGNPVVWLSRLAGQRVELVPGSELIDPVADLAARHRVPTMLVGATGPTLKAAAQALAARHPGLTIVGLHAPAMGFDPEGAAADAAIAAIEAAGARLCFLALGAPRQEIFAARAQARLPSCGFLSIGAGLDFVAGTQKRAPRIVRRFAAEWLWRMALSPRRLGGRYMACIAILPSLTLSALKARATREEPA